MIARRVAAAGAGLLIPCGLLAGFTTGPQTPDYQPTPESLSRHQTPQWYDDAKLGFFIHWGPYSVPAFAPPEGGGARDGSDVYAEWYWYEMNHPGSPTYEHHAETYGADVPYDAFIDQWRAEHFDPRAWLDLFVDGGAQYFVFTSKHHDGVALWDTDTTDRDTVALGPQRDFTAELFEAAEDYPLKTGLYFSLAEWYHPDGGWVPPRGHSLEEGPVNPYTGEAVPYTGYEPADDDVMDLQYPQMLELVDRFDPDIFWCDIGDHVPHNSNEFMAHYYNQAKNRPEPKGVAVNDRCGNGVHDFVTREYRDQPDIDPQPWEATRGIGRSFGYNEQEGPEVHLTGEQVVHTLVDTVAKNGNLLLNIGPKADGTIPEIQADRVRTLGAWLDVNGEAIYGTTYWRHAEDANSDVPVRYTVADGALYATALEWPGDDLTLSGDIPLSNRSTVTLLGSDGEELPWTRDDGLVTVTMPEAGASATTGEHAYTFKIETAGLDDVNDVVQADLEVPDSAGAGEAFTAEVAVTNPGDTTARAVRVGLDVPDGWTAAPRRAVETGIPPGQSRTIPFTVTPAPGSGPERFPITARASTGRLHQEVSDDVVVGFDSVADVLAPEKLAPGVFAAEGTSYYVDREFTIASLPPALRGATLIRGSNDDKRLTDPAYLTIEARADLDLYVALDPRGAPENDDWWPPWVDDLGFQPTGEQITVSGDPGQTALHLYRLDRVVAAGEQLVLGGNGATTGSSGSYITLAVEH